MPPESDTLPPKPAVQTAASSASTALATEAPSREGSGRHRVRSDLTTGSIPKKLFGQAWPQVIEGILNIADEFVDLFWAGRLPAGFRAIASVGVAQTITGFAGRARQGFDVAMRAMIARAVGAKNIPLANHILFQGLLLSGIYSIGMVLIGVFLTGLFLGLLGVSEELRAGTMLYMQIQFVGSATQSLRNLTGVALQAAGEPVVPMRATAVTRVLHVVLSPFLIFGWSVFPEMGLPGSALATVLAQGAGIAINLFALTSGQSRLHFTFLGRPDPALIWRMIKTGSPASVRGVERGMSQVALLGLVTPFGDVALAGYALTRRLEMLTNFGS
ncbi:MAG: putative efflux protein, family, partial [Dehalococcoidia bacterium]|nr:putative efflux protein, family [Dehalococcoidia bacterium]